MLLAGNRGAAEDLMSRAHDLAVKLPGTMALFLAGRLPEARVKIIAYATALLDRDEARAAEELVLGRAAGAGVPGLAAGQGFPAAAGPGRRAATARVWRSGSRGGTGRVRGAGDVDGPAGDAGRAGGPGRGAGRDRAHRPVAGPGPGR